MKVMSKEECPIQKLDQDSLICILRHLSIPELMRVERVSKHFQEAAKQSWTGMKKFTLTPKNLGLKPVGTSHAYKDINEIVVEKLLARCGKSLKEIDVTALKFDVSYFIGKYCKNVQSVKCHKVSTKGMEKLAKNCKINLRYLELPLDFEMSDDCLLQLPLNQMIEIKGKLSDSNLVVLSKHAKNLRNISYSLSRVKEFKDFFTNICNLTALELLAARSQIECEDKMVARVFKRNRQLRTIKLDHFGIVGKCFLHLNNESVEKITVSSCRNLQGDELIKSWSFFKKLRKLRITNNDDWEFQEFSRITECIGFCRNLKELDIESDSIISTEDLIKCVRSTANLEMLCIKVGYFERDRNKFFYYISRNLLELRYLRLDGVIDPRALKFFRKLEKLKYLYVRLTNDLGIEEMLQISKLTDLEELNVSNNDYFRGTGLSLLSNLKKLICHHCEELEDGELISFLRCADKLELLDIEFCKEITNSVIHVAIEVTKNRTNNILLQINVFGTSIKLDEIKERSPLLLLHPGWSNIWV